MKIAHYTEDYLSAPDPEFDIDYWGFSADLRENWVFRDCSSNYVAVDLLKEAGLVGDDADLEYSCFYGRFDSKEEGLSFLEKLNAFMEKRVQDSPDLVDKFVKQIANYDGIAKAFIKADPERVQQYLAWVRESLENGNIT
jgi:hypothetical protein